MNHRTEFDEKELLNKYIKDCHKYKIISQAEVTKTYKEIENNPNFLKEGLKKIAKGNLRMVILIARKYYLNKMTSYLTLLDLIGAGNEGLMVAAQKYETSFNVKFNTYAVWWIKQKIQRTLALHKSIANIPYWKTNIYCSSVSLDDEDSSIYLKYKENICIKNERINKINLKKDVENILKILSEKERTIIKKRYGIPLKDESYYPPFTQGKIAKEIGKSTPWARYVECGIIKKIREYIETNNLEKSFNF